MSSLPSSPDRRRSAPLLFVLAAFAIGLLLAACSGDEESGLREVLVDYNHDEFAGSFLGNFPHEVRVKPGMTLRFKQAWTGEPHSITGGRIVDEVMSQIVPMLEKYQGTPFSEIPEDDFMMVDELGGQLPPYMLSDEVTDNAVNQNVAQPCFRREGGPPDAANEPCPDEEQEQPAFDGRFDFYNSGFIGYEGPEGNEFEMQLAEDIAPGTYYFYCNVHGFMQHSKVVVVNEDEEIPSQAEVAKKAREEIERWAQPLVASYEQAQQADDQLTLTDPFMGEEVTFEKPFAGFATEDPWIHGFGSEFVPRDMTVKAGENVTWSFIGGHTVSFQVPAYFSQMEIEDDGTVIFNPDALLPVNSPSPPEPPEPPGEEGVEGPEGQDGQDGEEGGPPPPRPPPPAFDAGEWDGEEFISSGMMWEGTWGLAFTEPGTYKYACLIHPRMVGTVTVET
ncbi:MAG: hypothetical protein KY437_00325 [Actinobacteria bacterium]|nr:hypothetical protein [Actinomycetota bacterium]